MFLTALAAGDMKAARAALVGPMKLAYDEHRKGALETSRQAAKEAKQISNDTAAEGTRGLILAGAVLLLLAIICFSATIAVMRSIEVPLSRVRELFQAMARRDLTVKVDMRNADEFSDMTQLAMQAVDSVRDLLRSLAEQSDALAGASEELRVVSEHMSANA